jgi:hypothetical protein
VALAQEVAAVCAAAGVPTGAVPDAVVAEMYVPRVCSLGRLSQRTYARSRCRYGGSELHAVAAVVGGVVAQEAVKLLTGQFVPLRTTWLYNGVRGSSVALAP